MEILRKRLIWIRTGQRINFLKKYCKSRYQSLQIGTALIIINWKRNYNKLGQVLLLQIVQIITNQPTVIHKISETNSSFHVK